MKSASHIEAPRCEDSINGQHQNHSQKQSEKYLCEAAKAAPGRSLRNFHAELVYASGCKFCCCGRSSGTGSRSIYEHDLVVALEKKKAGANGVATKKRPRGFSMPFGLGKNGR